MERPGHIRKGDTVELAVENLAFGGKGVAKLDDFVVFVNGAVPGDVARAVVTKVKRRYAEARAVGLVTPSPDRTEPRCPHFGACGGCVWQNLDYNVQLAYKTHQVAESLEHLGGLRDFELLPAVGMANPWRYRNRADFSIGQTEEGAVVGFRPPGRWDLVLALSECHLLGAEMEAVRTTVEAWLRECGLPGWDPRTNTGFARHLLVRSARQGAELLVSLVTAPGTLPEKPDLVERLRRAHPNIVGIAHTVNAGRAELSAGLDYDMLWGRSYLLERLCGIELKISLNAFFQTNTLMAHELYRIAAQEVLTAIPYGEAHSAPGNGRGAAFLDEAGGSEAGRPVIWDLYSGVGSIGLALAARAGQVLGIEAVPDALEAAEENARLNGIENAHFLEGDVRAVLRELAQGKRSLPEEVTHPDVVVVDPPRAGLHRRVVDRIGELGVERVVYVSCNPATMAPDIARLQDYGYRLLRVTPVDMFPHTPHVEAVGLLIRTSGDTA